MAKFGNTAIKKVGNSKFLHIPSELANDKDFPFDEKDEDLVMEAGKKGLKVKKYGKD
jgi:hypothetical protein